MIKSSMIFLTFAAVAAVFQCTTSAFPWGDLEDVTMVEQSELIVVGHLKTPGEIKVVSRSEGDYESHLTLEVADVIKGKSADKEIPVILNHGICPTPQGAPHFMTESFKVEKIQPDNPEKGAIRMFSFRNTYVDPGVDDLRVDRIWFLCKRGGTDGRKVGQGTQFRIAEPGEIQPLKFLPYYKAYLATDKQKAVADIAPRFPEKKKYVKRYNDYCAIQKIMQIKDPVKRSEKLLPYFLARTTWNGRDIITPELIACGHPAGDQLKNIFDDPRYKDYRQEIIKMWGKMKYQPAVPILIKLLEKEDKFWATQKLKQGWWNDFSSEAVKNQTRKRRNSYGEVYASAYVLGQLGDPAAIDALELTQKRWGKIKYENPQILECTRESLARLTK